MLRRHVAAGEIGLEYDPEVLERQPAPLAAKGLWNRLEGMLLGLMIGDSLGNRSESMLPSERHRQYGEIRDYLPNRFAGNRCVGLPSDDSQLAFWTVESLLEEGGLDPDALARKFCGSRIFGIGRTVREFIGRYRDEQRPWYDAGPRSAGNGALMRIAPVLLPHIAAPSIALWSDAAVAATVTHNDPSSTASCVAFVSLLWELLGRDTPPESAWWLDHFLSVLRPLEGKTRYQSRVPGDAHDGSLWAFLEERLPAAHAHGRSTLEACNGWYSGAYLLETVPSALYILMQHGHDPEEAIIRAVNDTRDNDTIGAIVGAAVGALHGRQALPSRWVDGLLGRTRDADDGHAFDLLREARKRWVPSGE